MARENQTTPFLHVVCALVFLIMVAWCLWWVSLQPVSRSTRVTVGDRSSVAIASEPVNISTKVSTLGLLPFEEYDADFNGNGTVEHASVQSIHDVEGNQILRLTVADTILDVFGVSPDPHFYLLPLEKDTPPVFVLTFAGPSSDYTTHFIRFVGTKLQSIGSINGALTGFDGEGNITILERANMLDTWFFEVTYHLIDGSLQRIARPFYERLNSTNPVQALQSMIVHSENVSAYQGPIVLNAGDLVTILGCDNIDTCVLETALGRRGTFSASLAMPLFDGWSAAD
jgi:hypothetical protein